MNKLEALGRQIASTPCADPSNDVIICAAIRTPITKAKKGGLKDALPEDLLAVLFKTILERTKLDPKEINDICIGNVLQVGAGALGSRIAAILGGVPTSVPIYTTNRQCSSGLQAVASIAAAIQSGSIEVGIGGGVESMTHFDMMSSLNPEKLSDSIFESEAARNCLIPMGMTSENLARQYGISRQAQDEFAVESHAKATAAQAAGLYDEEIVPVNVQKKDSSGKIIMSRVSKDDGIRPDTTMAALAKLRPSFDKDGTTTAGNSSQVSDGAALVLLARRSAAERLNLPILGRFVSFACVGVPPEIMGIGPAFAIPCALSKAGLTLDDISIFELNEAFASQCSYCVDKLGIPKEKLNPKGGAIALGHPLGCTGARQIATILPELRRRRGKFGVVSMCIGTGMGAAAVVENMQFY